MGKKGKKGKKSGKKSGKAKKDKKEKEPQMTIREAILAYQINVKENALEEFMYEIKGLEEKRQRNKERNERLKEEQLYHIKTLLKQAKERDKELEQVTVINKEQVETSLKEKWRSCKEEEKAIEDLKNEISETMKQYDEDLIQVKKWTEYKDKGSIEHAKHIKLLQEELEDMQKNFEEMTAHLERTLNIAKEEIKKETTERLDEQKYIASELEIHKEETILLQEEVEGLERDNLEVMGQLFDCRTEDLKISRKFYLTQFEDNEDLTDGGILEFDLATSAISQGDMVPPVLPLTQGPRKQRPQSATQRAVEQKVFSLLPPEQGQAISEGEDEEEEEEDDEEVYARHRGEEEEYLGGLDNYLNFDDEDFDDYLKLGPLELKLLSIEGHTKPIHTHKKLSDQEEQSKLSAPDVWPVTGDMLRSVTRTSMQET
ncbi:coiled-coil domain-containing protein 83 isoform X2 [Strongylocentrotus purpuratus]|uniref:Coiled-coil domain-containing protein 83 n=1 Tax=Strongylocentrotus purpuratus TaxID=7668 RepID=A0A7M7PFS8_STRPU|nr:coiled-coil domain-containing protein 83 isoform X2 [Strongylocentrotus purpuratus]